MGLFGRKKEEDDTPPDPSDTFDIGGVMVATTANKRGRFIVSTTAGNQEDWLYIKGQLTNFLTERYAFEAHFSGNQGSSYAGIIDPKKPMLTYDNIKQACEELKALMPDKTALDKDREVSKQNNEQNKLDQETRLLEKKATPYLEATRSFLRERGTPLNEHEEAKLLTKFVEASRRQR